MTAMREKRPRCPKCKGTLLADQDISGQTISVGCVNCGLRHFRGVERRHPTKSDAAVGSPAGHRKTGISRSAGGVKC